MNKVLFTHHLISILKNITPPCIALLFMYSGYSTAALPEEEFFADVPVVLTATRLLQPMTEAPAATTVIDREMIKASGARKISELFRLVPGFVVSNEDGHTPIVMYHGLSDQYSRRMQVLVDGRSIYSPSTGGVEWTDLPLSIDDIERIEIIRGPNASSYGTNSFLSVINITTLHTTETTGASVRATRGTNDIKDAFLRVGHHVDNFSHSLSLSYNHDDGFEGRENGYHVRFARYRSDYLPSNKDSINFQVGRNNNTRELLETTLQEVEARFTINQYEQIKWDHQISNTEDMSLLFSHTSSRADENYDTTILPLGRVVVDNTLNSERYDMEFQHTLAFNNSTLKRLVWGLGTRLDSVHGVDIFGTNAATGYTGGKKTFYNRHYRSFANIELLMTDKLLVNLGAMIENSVLADTTLSPHIGANYLITPEQSIRASISRATRTPTFLETDMNYRVSVTGSQLPWCPGGPPCDFVSTIGTGNPNLDVETITAYELGYHAYFVKEKLSFDLKLYRELVRNLIGADRTQVINNEDLYDGENWTFGNFTDSDIEGVELALEINPSPYTRIIFSHSSLLNLNGINDNVSSEDLDATFPDDITSILAIQRMPNDITASFLYTNISRSNGLGTGNEIPGHARLDFRLAAEFGSSKLSGELSFVYQNMLDDYIDWKDQNIFENYRFINLSLKW